MLPGLDDSINPKTGKKILACRKTFDHAAKTNQTRWPWAQTIVTVGQLNRAHSRWSCLPLAFAFSPRRKNLRNARIRMRGMAVVFRSKFARAADRVVMPKTPRCPVPAVWMYRKSQWIALASTDLDLSIEQIVKYYSARWKTEAGFREIKQEIGSSHTQTRNPDAVSNHLHFCMAGATITCIYAE